MYHVAGSAKCCACAASSCAVILAAGQVLAGHADAGEIRGRILLGERPAPGVTVSAIPYEAPDVEARRLARERRGPEGAGLGGHACGRHVRDRRVRPLAGAAVRLLAEGGGVVPSWIGGTYDATESDDLG